MSFDYSTTGLPSNPHWMLAAQMCHQWLGRHMTMFGPERHLAFMQNQPVAAARRVFDNCDDFSSDCITVLLLGPAKDSLIESAASEFMARQLFGDGVVEIVKAMFDMESQAKAAPHVQRDCGRIVLAEGISTMNDQLIGRARIDRHHAVRWNILLHLEEQADILKGRDPKLDALFADALLQSRQALEALDAAAGQKPPRGPKP